MASSSSRVLWTFVGIMTILVFYFIVCQQARLNNSGDNLFDRRTANEFKRNVTSLAPDERLRHIIKTREFQEILNQTRNAGDAIRQLSDRGNACHPPELVSYDVSEMRTPQSRTVVKGKSVQF